ncbi:MAG: putative crossover junction endodeoxyribonuclease [Prokaryotic dsDNA virus sp.]|nr:MAG: putative crossover junction endodeoxyribonuclease [Prokaryotic dsDNA virus sp.]
MSKVLRIDCPVVVLIPRKTKEPKKFRVNLNYTNNAHYLEYNKAKKLFKDMVEQILKDTGQDHIKFTKPVDVTAKLYKQSRRRSDKHNFIAANTKFLYDALTELGVLIDDNDDYVKMEVLHETEVDKDNPRVSYVFTERDEV